MGIGLLSVPAQGLRRLCAMEVRYGEEQERVEIIPLGGNLAFDVIPRSKVPEPLCSDGFAQVERQEEPMSFSYHFNPLEAGARIEKIWVSPVNAYEPLEGQDSLPMTGTLPLLESDMGGENRPIGSVYLVCPKVEAAGSRETVIMRGSPGYCGVLEANKANQESLSALADSALPTRPGFSG